MRAFEITSLWVTFRPLIALLRSVEGVSDVRRNYLNDDRLSFRFHKAQFVVFEPFGDNSRYWVGPMESETALLDLKPVHETFRLYSRPILDFIDRLRRAGNV